MAEGSTLGSPSEALDGGPGAEPPPSPPAKVYEDCALVCDTLYAVASFLSTNRGTHRYLEFINTHPMQDYEMCYKRDTEGEWMTEFYITLRDERGVPC